MDVIDDNNADNNNNLERILTESLARIQDYRIDIQMVDVNDMSGNDISRYSADEGNTAADIAQPHDADIRGNQGKQSYLHPHYPNRIRRFKIDSKINQYRR